MYTRIVQTIGIDVRKRDGVIYKCSDSAIPRSIHVTKCPDKNRKGSKLGQKEFTSRYVHQKGSIDPITPLLANLSAIEASHQDSGP